jgi:hypothetical protein
MLNNSGGVLTWMLLVFFVLAIVFSHLSGNDKASYLVLLCCFFSVILGIFYITKSLMLGAFLQNVWEINLAIFPAYFVLIVFVLARYDLLDPQTILGFR